MVEVGLGGLSGVVLEAKDGRGGGLLEPVVEAVLGRLSGVTLEINDDGDGGPLEPVVEARLGGLFGMEVEVNGDEDGGLLEPVVEAGLGGLSGVPLEANGDELSESVGEDGDVDCFGNDRLAVVEPEFKEASVANERLLVKEDETTFGLFTDDIEFAGFADTCMGLDWLSS